MTEAERIQSIKNNGGLHLSKFKPENITYQMCLAAVKSTGYALEYVPDNFRTEEIYLEACKKDGGVLQDVPKAFVSEALYKYAVISDGCALQYIPIEYRTRELCLMAVINDALAYNFVPIEFITPEFVAEVAKESNYETISCLPKSLKNNSFYIAVINCDPEFIWVIPRKSLTAKIGKAAVRSMGYSTAAEAVKATPKLLSHLHASMYDHDTCLNFVLSDYFKQAYKADSNGNCNYGFNSEEDAKKGLLYLAKEYTEVYSLPDMMKWEDVAIAILEVEGKYLKYVTSEKITEDMCKAAITANPDCLEIVPEKFKTKELCLQAFKADPWAIEYIPEKYITDELAITAVKHCGYLLEYIPEKYRTKEVCIIAVSSEDKADIEYVPSSVLDRDICLAWLTNPSLEVHPLDKIPKEFWDYDVCMAAVKLDGEDLEKVPDRFVDKAMCLAAVNRCPSAAKFVPGHIVL